MYKRNLVYSRFRIDTFIDWETMRYKEHDHMSGYINDESVFKEVLDILEDGKKFANGTSSDDDESCKL